MKNVLMLGTGELVMSEILNKRGIDLNEGHRLPDLLNQCNPCVMCSSNPFHCKERKDCKDVYKRQCIIEVTAEEAKWLFDTDGLTIRIEKEYGCLLYTSRCV